MDLKDNQVLRINQVSELVGLAPSTIYELQAEKPPRFPKSFKIIPNGRAAGWYAWQILEWLKNRTGANK